MLRLKKHIRQTMDRLDRQMDPSRHGSVLILVVVLLVLMALLGTAYLVTAKNDRVATRLYEHNVQIDMLVQGVVNLAKASMNASAPYQLADTQYFDDFMSDAPPQWSNTTTYAVGNSVTYNGYCYSAVVGSTGAAPPTNPTQWQQINGTIDHTWLAARIPGLLTTTDIVGYIPGATLYPVPKGTMVSGATGQWYMSLVDNNTAGVAAGPNWAVVSPVTAGLPAAPLGYTTATAAWAAVSSPLLVNAYAEDVRGAAATINPSNNKPVNPANVRTYCAPSFVSVNGTNYPALSYYSLANGSVETAMAASASGDGIADSFLWRLPIGTIDGITYYAAVRIIDNGSQVNINTAMSSTTDYTGTGGAESTIDGFAPGMFKSQIGLLELTNSYGAAPAFTTAAANPEISQLDQYRFNTSTSPYLPAGISLAAPLTTPTADSGSAVGFNSAGTAYWMYRNVGDALQNILGRRLDNPGYASPGRQAQALSWGDAAALAYKFDLRNSVASPTQSELCLNASLWSPSAGTYLQSSPWDPSQVSLWFNQYSDTLAIPTPAKNRRPFLTPRNPVSNQMPAHMLNATTTGLPQAGLNVIGTYMTGSGNLAVSPSSPYQPMQYSTGVIPKVSINTADVTTQDYLQYNTPPLVAPLKYPPKGPTLWLGFYNAMLDATTTIPGFMNVPGATVGTPPGYAGALGAGVAQFRSPLRDMNGFGTTAGSSTTYLTGPETLLLRSLLAAANAKDLRDSGDNVTVAGIGGFPAVVNKTPTTVTLSAFGTERQPFITEVYASTEFLAPNVIGQAGTKQNNTPVNNLGKTNPKGYVAVELYNPYDYPVDMTNWTLVVATRTGGTPPLTVAPIAGFLGFGNAGDGQSPIIPPKSYMVLENFPGLIPSQSPGTDAQYRPYINYTGVNPPPGLNYYVPNLSQVIHDPANPAQPGGELILLRQPYAKGSNGYNVKGVAGANTFPAAFLQGMPAADSFDFTGVIATSGPPVAPPGISPPVTEIHYVRANQGNAKTVEPAGHGWKWGWKFVYPGRWDPRVYGPYMQEGIEVMSYTPVASPTTPQAPGTYSMWADAAPTTAQETVPILPAVTTAINLGLPDPDQSYVNNFPPIQLNNTDFGGPSKCFTSPFVFPYGGFARVGDILQTPFIGAYTILDSTGTQVIEINSVSRDCATADDLDNGGTDDYVEQVGRFCPLLAAEQVANGVETTYVPPGAYDSYAWASHVFEYFSVLDNPNDDYMPNMDPNDYAVGAWNMSILNYQYSTAMPYSIAPPVGQTSNSGNGPDKGTEDVIGVDGLVNINTASWRVLTAVPWVYTTGGQISGGNGQIAQAIVQYRNTYGPFKSLFDLNRVVIKYGTASNLQNYAGNVAGADFSASVGNISPLAAGQTTGYSGSTADYVTNDFENRFMMMNRVSNCITTRSDTFTVYVLVQGWSGAGTANPQLVVQRRAAFIEDRTPLTPTNSTPNITPVQSQ